MDKVELSAATEMNFGLRAATEINFGLQEESRAPRGDRNEFRSTLRRKRVPHATRRI